MCGIAGIVYKDKKLHCAGNDMTNMLHQLQHRGPDSAGYSIYGGTGLKDDEYIISKKTLNFKQNESKIEVGVFFKVYENITDFKDADTSLLNKENTNEN